MVPHAAWHAAITHAGFQIDADITLFAFAQFFEYIARNCERFGIDGKIDFISTRSPPENTIRVDWAKLEAISSAKAREIIGDSPVFRDDKLFLPLQAADFSAS